MSSISETVGGEGSRIHLDPQRGGAGRRRLRHQSDAVDLRDLLRHADVGEILKLSERQGFRRDREQRQDGRVRRG